MGDDDDDNTFRIRWDGGKLNYVVSGYVFIAGIVVESLQFMN